MEIEKCLYRFCAAIFATLFVLMSPGRVFAENAVLATAPHVPAPVKRKSPATVVVNFEAREITQEIDGDKKYKFWTFNGTTPGPMIRVRVGDSVQFHLANHKDNQWPHNIDLHAVNGPGGGAHVNEVKPGEASVFTFKTLKPGLYIYHCAAGAPSIPHHISNGMYGLILVEPEEGMSDVDKEFYVFQSEFFTKSAGKENLLELDFNKGMADQPDYVFFNGKAGALMGDNVIKANAGDNVRIYFGNIGPNNISSFHVIGEIFDKVYMEGSIGGAVNHNVQTTLVPSAGATIVEMKVDVPGSYILVDHSIYRVAKGAIGILAVGGKEDNSIFKKGK
ncbi:MAG: copper-containing nitrite reductase [Nitrospira sp.]|nr:nitrite reductase, copper-containing [Candidatus Manganitrophaceae bacterium]HIL34028.1 nitrite reductase, copper-containing [Candidatus Manganitrophaceae bacterium]